MTEGWSKREVPLRFRISVRTLVSFGLTVLFREQPLAITGGVDLSPPPVPLTKDLDGFCIRSIPLEPGVSKLTFSNGLLRYVESRYPRYYIDMRTSFEGYVSKFSSKSRSTIRRKIRKLEEYFGEELDFRVYRSVEELEEFHRLARPLSQRTYQDQLLDAGLPVTDAFTDEMYRLAARDEVRAFLLFGKKEPLAYLYCPVREDRLIFQYLGFDPVHAKLSVGTVLQWLSLQHLFGEGRHALFDFTGGESEHKRFYSTGSVSCGDVFFLKPGPRTLGLAFSHAIFNRFVASVRALAERWKVRGRLVKLLRTT